MEDLCLEVGWGTWLIEPLYLDGVARGLLLIVGKLEGLDEIATEGTLEGQ